jgi:pimeloyl-ACP methyl ester carboxylesterase
MTHHVIYVSGLGDHRSHGQDAVPANWNKYGVVGHYNPMMWSDKESFAPKLQRLLERIDTLSADGPVSLVGVSAGASVVLLALVKRPDKVAGVVCIAGKIMHPETVDARRYAENPAFKESMSQLQKALPEIQAKYASRIMSIHPLYDGSVPPRDTIIPGAREKTVLTIGHAMSIFLVLVFWSGLIIRFLQEQAAKMASYRAIRV